MEQYEAVETNFEKCPGPDYSITNYLLLAVGDRGISILDYVGQHVDDELEAAPSELLEWFDCEEISKHGPFVIVEGFKVVMEDSGSFYASGEMETELTYDTVRSATDKEMTDFLANKAIFMKPDWKTDESA